ncbi:MAG: transporter substrate-binding domain-containing protein [Butyrivibrio sp.]|nr:transporter substrate-binding domain-containing protein [Butyrivibrio sp.]
MTKRIISVFACLILISTSACSKSYLNNNIIGADVQSHSDIKVIDINLTEEAYGIGVDKEHTDLLEAINSALSDIKADGTYDEIISHYETEFVPEPVETAKLDSSKDQLVVATTSDFPPFDYEKDGQAYGIDKELIKEIADRLGKELVLVDVNFDIMFLTVSDHKADACIAGITITDERKKYIDFSDPYYIDGLQVAVRTDNTDFDNCKTVEDINNVFATKDSSYKVAVEANTTGEDFIQLNNAGLTIDSCPDQADCIDKLNLGKVDCVIGDAGVLKYLLTEEIED